ncbi:MAG: DUF1800 domain-containing protein [Chloroflexi bacterium]|nr:DUF1800 domain-containing protein [Chloroflexota bacterium]
MSNQDIELMAHLMRRAGFGATRDELEARVAKGYEATVEELLNPEMVEGSDRLDFLRYQPGYWKPPTSAGMGGAVWLNDMVNSQRVLQEKMVLFWHQVFATGYSKIDHFHEVFKQIDMFRDMGMGNYRDLLVALAKDPAMIYWLDNCDNHVYAVNENWGRELLELFSMGVGNYTEDDVRECSRAFTGWTISPMIPRQAYGRFDWEFEYQEEDHDDEEKNFLGHTGNFDGEDIIDIVCAHPATARFVARHLYNFFVADEAQVPAWSVTPPNDPEAIELLAQTFVDSGYDMTPVLRVLFNADFFKNARFAKIKSPVEVVVGTLRMVGDYEFPAPGIGILTKESGYMGQELMNPPSVEGWHTGAEWINSGSLMKRINFSADMVAQTDRPGIRSMVNRLREQGDLTPEQLVDGCLDLMGPLTVQAENRQEMINHVGEAGDLNWGNADAEDRVTEMLQLVVSLREYQYA